MGSRCSREQRGNQAETERGGRLPRLIQSVSGPNRTNSPLLNTYGQKCFFICKMGTIPPTSWWEMDILRGGVTHPASPCSKGQRHSAQPLLPLSSWECWGPGRWEKVLGPAQSFTSCALWRCHGRGGGHDSDGVSVLPSPLLQKRASPFESSTKSTVTA